MPNHSLAALASHCRTKEAFYLDKVRRLRERIAKWYPGNMVLTAEELARKEHVEKLTAKAQLECDRWRAWAEAVEKLAGQE